VSRHLRYDKTCLNCGTVVEDRFCPHCGQENLEPIESVGHLVSHFFEDLTHFDGKFFVTVKDLILRPGFLTREYVLGRRMTYLNPIRMYVFISAMFFLVLFAGSEKRSDDALPARADTSRVKSDSDSLGFAYSSAGTVQIFIVENKYTTLREYDSLQLTLPDSAKDKGIDRWVSRNNVKQKEKHGGRSRLRLEVDVHHDIPKIMFILLPLFALYVSWFYNRKKYYYVNHAIFSVHIHCFAFLLLLFLRLLDWLIPGEWAKLALIALMPILLFIYLVAALRGMYGQSFWISLGKAVGITTIYTITFAIASTLLMILSIFRL